MAGDRELILAANQAFYRAFEKKDLETMEAVWSKGLGCLCIHPGRDALKGWADIRMSWERIFQNTQYLEIDTDVLTLEVGGDVGYVVLVEHVLQIGSGRRIEAQSMATNGFERMGGRWYLTHHHGSPIVD